MRLNVLTLCLDGFPWLPAQLATFNRLTVDWHWFVVEGAASNVGCTKWCKPQEPRLSNDGSTEFLNNLKSHPRVTVIQQEQWQGKVEMCNAPMALITEPGVLFQIDADEIYDAEELEAVVRLFEVEETTARMRFQCRYFVGPNIVTHEEKPSWWLRAWRFTPGMTFDKHEPPILAGNRGKCVDNEYVKFDHYSYVLESQVAYKEKFYGYTGAVKQWKKLQANTVWPVDRLTDFLPWAGKHSSADLFIKPTTETAPTLDDILNGHKPLTVQTPETVTSSDTFAMPTLDDILNANKPQTEAKPYTPPPNVSASQAYKNRAGPFPRPAVRRFLLVLNHYDGDRDAVIEQAMLIHDLQKERSPDTDVVFYHRNDARPMDNYVLEKMRAKFLRVSTMKCSRLNARGHPYGCNEMWYALIEFMRGAKWATEYYGFFNLEPDCTPLCPDWLAKVSAEFRHLNADGFGAVGHIKSNPSEHLNGAAIYSTNFFNMAGGLNIAGGPTGTGYDLYHAARILPVSADTPLIGGRWGVQSLSDAEVWGYQKEGGECVVLHAAKDDSVRQAVRRKWLGGK